jgi:tetratricopeptide (TPR) repeat protein
VSIAALALLAILTMGSLEQPAPKTAGAVPDRAALLKQAGEAQQAGRTDEALRLFHRAAEKYQSVQAYLELARLQSRTRQAAAALDSLVKARELAPNSEEVLSAYAQLALAAKMPVPAAITLQALTRVFPTVPQHHYLLGVALMGLGDLPGAVDSLTEASRLEPDRPLTLTALGLALNHRKLFADAKTALSRSLELQPDDMDTVAALAEAEAGLGNLETASTLARRALERSPANATANMVTALVSMERREYAAARDALLKTIAADPDAHKALYQLSLAYARLGDEAAARRYVELYQEKLRLAEKRLEALYEKRF